MHLALTDGSANVKLVLTVALILADTVVIPLPGHTPNTVYRHISIRRKGRSKTPNTLMYMPFCYHDLFSYIHLFLIFSR